MSAESTAHDLGNENQEPESAESGGEAIERDLHEARQQVLRAQADFENYRKRVRRERDEERQFAQQPLLLDLLQVGDNLERALAAGDQESSSGLAEGVRMVAAQLKDVLRQHHCEPIPALGEPFDPHLHEAISQQASADQPAGTVLVEVQRGYRLHDRVIRPSQVIVSTGSPENS